MKRFIIFLLSATLVFILNPPAGNAQCPGGLKLTIKAVPTTLSNDTLPVCPLGCWCRSAIMATVGLVAIKGNYEIISYVFTASDLCNDKSGDVYEAKVNGNRYNPVVTMLLNRSCEGTTISFECIKARNKSGQIFKLEPFSVTLQ